MYWYAFIACVLMLWGYWMGRIHQRNIEQRNFEKRLQERLKLAHDLADMKRREQTDYDQNQDENPQ